MENINYYQRNWKKDDVNAPHEMKRSCGMIDAMRSKRIRELNNKLSVFVYNVLHEQAFTIYSYKKSKSFVSISYKTYSLFILLS